jgi:ABC-type dipeptide/oligopeptide/nickel transport systems, permease components
MLKFIGKRLLNLIPVMFIISVLIFITVQALPGDPVNAYLGQGTQVSAEVREQIREELGLNDSLPQQYGKWVGRYLTGDLGTSIQLRQPVADIIGQYVWNTFLLNTTALIVALLFAIPIGIRQAVKKYSKFDNFWTVFSLFGLSVPTFFFALILIFFVALNVSWIPLNGMQDPRLAAFGYNNFFHYITDVAKHMILPVTVLAFGSFAVLSRYIRNAMIDVINQDYIRTARSKGLKEKVVIYRHAFRNAMIPLVTLLGIYIPSLFSGAIILESVFLWPGLGRVLIDAIVARDQSVITACLLFSAILMVLGNLLADVAYSLVDPRIKAD